MTIIERGSEATMATDYSTRDVSRLLKIPEHRVRKLARAGILGQKPDADVPLPRRYSFDFRDVLVLKMASKLLGDGFSSARVQRVLQNLREQLPEDKPLSGMQLFSTDENILVRGDGQTWEPESGQFMLRFEKPEAAKPQNSHPTPLLQPLETDPKQEMQALIGDLEHSDDYGSADAWFEVGVSLEEAEPQKAYEAYLRALTCNPEHVEAHINIGTLCSGAGELERAAAYFRQAIRVDSEQPVAHYNLAVTYHDLMDASGAISAYQEAIRCDPEFADAHFNLATLLEQEGQRDEAMVHLQAYKQICGQTDPL